MGKGTSARSWCAVVVLCAACAPSGTGSGPALTQGASTAREATQARTEALLSHLPTGADTCVVVRPAQLQPDQRELFAQISMAEPLAFAEALAIEAYVSVVRRRRGSRMARAVVFRTGAPEDRVRAALGRASGWDLRWEPGGLACLPDDCPSRARYVADGIVLVTQGDWLVPQGARGVERECAQMERQHPEAIEWSTTRGQALAIAGSPAMPLRSQRWVFAEPARLRLHRVHRMPVPELAAELAAGRLQAPVGRVDVGERVLGRSHDGTRFQLRTALLWEDLELRALDAARLAEAEATADALLRAQPSDDVDVRDRGALRAQVSYRLALLLDAPHGERAAIVAGLAALLQRAVEAYPQDAALAVLLVRLWLEHGGETERAAALAARYRDHPEHGATMRELQRWALARDDVDALAHVLVQARVVRRDRAPEAARSIAALVRAGHRYQVAEDAWVSWASLTGRAERQRTKPVEPVVLPLRSLVEGLLAARHLGGVTTGFSVVLTQPGAGLARVRSAPGRFMVDDDLVLQLEAGDTVAARAAGQALTIARPYGPLRLLVSPRPDSARLLVLQGEVDAAGFHVMSADLTTAGVDLPKVARRLFQPLSTLHTGHFELSTSDRDDARRMRKLAASAFGIACTTDETAVRCRVGRGDRRRAREAVLAMASGSLTGTLRRMWGD